MNITKEFLENGYIIHNETQISLEIDGQIILQTVKNTESFVNENILNEASKPKAYVE
jgi:hypothetical protein